MLAYVFWHWHTNEVDWVSYVTHLTKFQDSLRNAKPKGLLHAESFQTGQLPWLGADSGYEDWYVVNGSADLDILNDAAISGVHQSPHDQIARLAAGGTAGLYRLRVGTLQLEKTRFATWFHKPAGFSYQKLYELIQPSIETGATLWGRQMTLGPTPEFCLHSSAQTKLAAPLTGLSVELKRI
jgi:hypothetical protein